MRPRRWLGTGAVIALALTLITIRSLNAPLFLYPSSGSLPAGVYVRSFEPIVPGKTVAFTAPKAAERYQANRGRNIAYDILFIKPIVAGPGDHVCNDLSGGLRINNVWIAPTAEYTSTGAPLPIWHECRRLIDDEFFMYSAFATNSFDSRYFGPVKRQTIRSVYIRWLQYRAPGENTFNSDLAA